MRALREGLAAVGTGIGPLACVRALVSCQLRPVAEAFATLSADVGCWWPRPGRGPRRRCRLGWGQLGRGPAGDVIVIHDEDVHWVLMTGHLLVLRIQWPRRPSFFSKLHIWVPPRPRGRHAALFLSPASRMVAAAAAATQTLGSGGRAPRPEVTFPAASARASPSPPPPRPPPLPRHSRQRSSGTPDRYPLRLYGTERRLGTLLPELSRTQVLRFALWRLAPRGSGPAPSPDRRLGSTR